MEGEETADRERRVQRVAKIGPGHEGAIAAAKADNIEMLGSGMMRFMQVGMA